MAEACIVSKGDEWVMDSGCSHHMSPNIDDFHDLQMGSFGSVQLGSSQVCRVEGIGSVRLCSEDGSECVLKKVRYVPSLRCNLISLGQLDNDGCEVGIKGGVMHVFKAYKVVLSGVKKRGIYVLNGSVFRGSNLPEVHGSLCVKNPVRGEANCDGSKYVGKIVNESENGLIGSGPKMVDMEFSNVLKWPGLVCNGVAFVLLSMAGKTNSISRGVLVLEEG